MTRSVALVVGGGGVVGRAIVQYLDTLDHWRTIALSRHKPDFQTEARFISCDLTDPDSCRQAASECRDVTHVFYTAYAPAESLACEAAVNTQMLMNWIEALEPQARGLEHIQLMQGSKWYGNHLGPYKTPAKESDPGHFPPNFYFGQQTWLNERARQKTWSWSALRPHGICGLAIGSSMNQLTAMAIYATMSKFLGYPLRWPGKAGAFNSVYQMTEASYLARGMLWAATESACANEVFNFTNGDFIRWCNLWPRLGQWFEMPTDGVQTLTLQVFMADKEPVWKAIRERYRLRNYSLEQLVNWNFADFVFGCEYDQMSDMTKARNAGWVGANDSEAMYLRLLDGLRTQRIIP